MELIGRACLITGGKRIGAVVATEVARKGADVALVYRRSRAEAEETAREVEALGRRAFVVEADLSQPDDCERACQFYQPVAKQHGRTSDRSSHLGNEYLHRHPDHLDRFREQGHRTQPHDQLG